MSTGSTQLSRQDGAVPPILRSDRWDGYGFVAIAALVLAFCAMCVIVFYAEAGRRDRDKLLLVDAIGRTAGDRSLNESDLAILRETTKIPTLRLVPRAEAGLLNAQMVVDARTEETLIWSGSVPLSRFLAICLPLFFTAIIAILGGMRIARQRAQSLQSVVSEIEGRALDMAMRDALTGLFNRAAFRRRLENAMAKRTGRELVAVIYIDLDRFKEVNDGFGHHAGDTLLCGVADRLRSLANSNVTIARLGGDEFAMIVERYSDEAAIVELGQAVSRTLGQPFDIGQAEASIGGSVGIAVAPADATETTELVRRADIAMYRVKTTGRGTALRFDDSMEHDARKRKSLEADLRRAFERDELHVAYQPYFSSDGETVVGVEALARWTHPEQGPISPGVFVPIAEDSGLIHQLSDFMMKTAMADAHAWPDLTLAMNMSPVQFRNKDIVTNILALVADSGINPNRIELEITEGVLVEDADTAVRVLKQFRDAGMHIALDDFGTGYSSLSYLRRFPFDKLKVDQSFVRNLGGGPGSAAIIHAVVSLGRALGLIVHAEGIESLEHHIFLRASGCHHLQGFYFARPMPAEQVSELVKSQTGFVRPYPRIWA